jgi:hypothetical protein
MNEDNLYQNQFFTTEIPIQKYPIILEECKTPIQNKIFREIIDTYHSYKKYKDSPTRNIRFLVYESITGNNVGAIGLSSATIAVNVRDNFIGWDNKTKIKNLGMLANNSRFCLIKDRFTIKNVGSMTLKRLEVDGGNRWKEKYNQDLILLETFVEPSENRTGCVYKATNWTMIGETQGHHIRKTPMKMWQKEKGERGRLARENPEECLKKYAGYLGEHNESGYKVTKTAKKIMLIKPLIKNWKERLLQ